MGQVPAIVAAVGLLLGEGTPTVVVSVGHAGEPAHATFVGDYLVTAAWSNVGVINLRSGLTVAHLPHGSIVETVAASPSGDLLAVGSCGHAIRLWDVKSWTLVQRIDLPQECAETLSFSPDGAYLAAGAYGCSSDDGLQVWEVRTGKLRKTLAPGSGIRHVVFGGDGRWLAAVDDNGRATAFEWPSGRRLRSYQGLSQPGYSDSRVIASDDGRYLGWLGSGLRVWDVRSGAEVLLPGEQEVSVRDYPHDGPQRQWTERHVLATAAAFLDDGRLAYIDGDKMFVRQMPHGPQQLRELAKPETEFFGDVGIAKRLSWLTIRRDGLLLAGAREAETITFDVGTGRVRELTAPALCHPMSLRWSRSGVIAWAGLGSGLQAWDDRGGGPAKLGNDELKAANALSFRPDGAHLAVSDFMSMSILDVAHQRVVRTRSLPPSAGTGVAYSPDGSSLAFASSTDGLGVFDDSLRIRRRISALDAHTQAEQVAFSPDGRWIAAGLGGPHTALRAWPTAGGEPVTLDTGDVTYGPQPPAFSADSRWLASFRQGSTLVIWAMADWKVARTWTLGGTGRALAFAPEGTRLAIASDGEAAIWDGVTGRKMVTFATPGSTETKEIAWSPEGQRVVSSADDGVLRLWNASDGRLLGSLYMLEAGGDWLLVAPDGRLDGSEAALARLIAWRINGRVVSDGSLTLRHRVRGLWQSIAPSARK
jgi:WD40 repeat protein